MLARTSRQRAKVRTVTARGAEQALSVAQGLCPRDTNYMADHMLLELTRTGYNFALGWRANQFVGQTNPVTGQEVTTFYSPLVVFGTRFMAGRDPITPALRSVQPSLRRGYARALADKPV